LNRIDGSFPEDVEEARKRLSIQGGTNKKSLKDIRPWILVELDLRRGNDGIPSKVVAPRINVLVTTQRQRRRRRRMRQ